MKVKVNTYVPELIMVFTPTTKGVEPFNVYETIHTLIHKDTLILLTRDNVYRDVTGKDYKLNEHDALKLYNILYRFMYRVSSKGNNYNNSIASVVFTLLCSVISSAGIGAFVALEKPQYILGCLIIYSASLTSFVRQMPKEGVKTIWVK